jgi:hypothetical protein
MYYRLVPVGDPPIELEVYANGWLVATLRNDQRICIGKRGGRLRSVEELYARVGSGKVEEQEFFDLVLECLR